HVWLSQIPMHDAFANVLLGQSEGETTTGRFTQVHTVFAVDPRLTLKGIFVVLGLLDENADTFFTILLHQSLCDFPLALVEFLDRKQTFLAEQLNQGVQKRSGLKSRFRIFAQPGVYVE